MQTKFLQISKIFSKESEKTGKALRKVSRFRKTPAGAIVRKSFPRAKFHLSCKTGKRSGYLPGRQQRKDRSRPRLPPGKIPHPQGSGAGFPGDGENRKTVQDSLPAGYCSQNARGLWPGSTPEPLPEAAFPGLLVNQSGNLTVHSHLPALQGEGF